jgi:antitoxin ParD1/3/4
VERRLRNHGEAMRKKPRSTRRPSEKQSDERLDRLVMCDYHSLVFIGIDEDMPMAKNTSMSLGEHFDQFIAAQLENGRYGSATEVVRAGLRLLETEEEKLDALRRLIDEGRKSGTAEYSYESFMAELDKDFS